MNQRARIHLGKLEDASVFNCDIYMHKDSTLEGSLLERCRLYTEQEDGTWKLISSPFTAALSEEPAK